MKTIKQNKDYRQENSLSDRKQLARLQSYTYLANAIFHLQDKSELDKRTIFITWHIPNRHLVKQAKYLLVRVVKNLIRRIDPDARFGMIVGGDISGTRLGDPMVCEGGSVHLHATIILPKWNFPPGKLVDPIRNSLFLETYMSASLVYTSAVDVRQYVPTKPYWDAVDYFNKGEKYVPFDWNFSPYIYPVDRYRRHRRRTNTLINPYRAKSFDAEIIRTRNQLIFDPRPMFSDLAAVDLSDEHLTLLDQHLLVPPYDQDWHKAMVIGLVEAGRL